MAKDLTGQKFYRLTVVAKHPDRSSSAKVQWSCVCECGTAVVTNTGALTSGNTKSCGCQRADAARENGLKRATHGMSGTPEYKTWQSMRDRCQNPKAEQYSNYGERGIQVCERWNDSFENFYQDMGARPAPNLSIDRREVNGDYEPGNCRWADSKTQSNNRRTNKYHCFQGEMLTVSEVARRLDIPVATLSARLRYGYTFDEATSKETHRQLFTHAGQTKNLGEWAKEIGMPYGKLYSRIVTMGWSFDKAISE